MLDIVTVDSVLDAFCATVKGDRSALSCNLCSSQYDTSRSISVDFSFSALSNNQPKHRGRRGRTSPDGSGSAHVAMLCLTGRRRGAPCTPRPRNGHSATPPRPRPWRMRLSLRDCRGRSRRDLRPRCAAPKADSCTRRLRRERLSGSAPVPGAGGLILTGVRSTFPRYRVANGSQPLVHRLRW